LGSTFEEKAVSASRREDSEESCREDKGVGKGKKKKVRGRHLYQRHITVVRQENRRSGEDVSDKAGGRNYKGGEDVKQWRNAWAGLIRRVAAAEVALEGLGPNPVLIEQGREGKEGCWNLTATQ